MDVGAEDVEDTNAALVLVDVGCDVSDGEEPVVVAVTSWMVIEP